MSGQPNLFDLDSYDYELPEELIAKEPSRDRSNSRLLCLDAKKDLFQHQTFSELPKLLKAGDLLILNETKVMPSRLYGKRLTGAFVEIFFLKQLDAGLWEALTKCTSRLKEGEQLFFNEKPIVEIVKINESGSRILKWLLDVEPFLFFEQYGEPPLPPYILNARVKTKTGGICDLDFERYQTVYAKTYGAVAAPTAGLHFTEAVFESLAAHGVLVEKILLHVGYGTFAPVKTKDIRQHAMHNEYFELSESTAQKIREVKKAGGRVIAVGTTSGRTLESCADSIEVVKAQKGETNIFIYPGYQFKVIDGMITNFHLPKSSLIMFISALVGYETLMKAYQYAIKEKYRFYSYGDAMLLLSD